MLHASTDPNVRTNFRAPKRLLPKWSGDLTRDKWRISPRIKLHIKRVQPYSVNRSLKFDPTPLTEPVTDSWIAYSWLKRSRISITPIGIASRQSYRRAPYTRDASNLGDGSMTGLNLHQR